MYKIIGADQKEYGPVSAEQILQWIAENRLDAQSKVQAEGGAEWKPLSAFHEFAEALAARPVPIAPPLAPAAPAISASAADQVRGPAIGLIVTAVLGFVANALGIVWNLFATGIETARPGVNPDMERFIRMFSGTMGIICGLVAMVVAGLIVYGALKMKKLESYGWAMTATILALVPCVSPCCLVGLPIGIWALIVLLKPEVKAQFA